MRRRFGWHRLSLAARLALGLTVTLIITATVLVLLTTRGDIRRQSAALLDRLERQLQFTVPALSGPVLVGDYAVIEQLMRAGAAQTEVASLEWKDVTGHRIVAAGPAEQALAPHWFVRWAELQAVERSAEIVVGGETYGQITLRLSPGPSIDTLWQGVQRRFYSVGIGASCLLAVLMSILHYGIAPLRGLGANVRRLGDGDHRVRMPVRGPPEVARSIEAFNAMAANVQAMVAALRESGEQGRLHAMLVEQTSDAIYLKDTDGRIKTWNQGAQRLYGFTAAEMIGQTTRATLHSHLSDEDFADLLQRTRSRQGNRFEAKRTTRTGDLLEVQITTGPLVGDGGTHLGEIVVVRDITELKRAQAALALANHDLEARVAQRTAELSQATLRLQREVEDHQRAAEELARTESQLRSVIDAIPGAVAFLDGDRRCRVFNRHVAEMFGLGAHEIGGRTPNEIVGEEVYGIVQPCLDKAIGGESAKLDWIYRLPNGETRNLETTMAPVLAAAGGAVIGTVSLSMDVTERKRADAELWASEARNRVLATMVEQSSDSIVARDLDGTITYWNKGSELLFGFSAEEAIGQPLRSVQLRELGDAEIAAIRARIRTGESRTFEAQRIGKNGEPLDLLISASPLFDEQGRLAGQVTVTRNISAAKAAERELRRAKEAAEAGSRAKSEFLANMSHEIRTPLNGILGLTDLVLDTPLAREQREHLALVKSSGESLLSIISNILDLSKIEAGHLDLDMHEFAPADSIAHMVKAMALQAHAKGLELIYDAAPDLPPVLTGDAGRLRQVVVNLVGNAIKFTQRGEVVVSVRCELQPDGSAVLELGVRDSGIGIPKDKHAAVFEAFTQADASTTRRFGGTGLGLTICARLVQLMGGRFTLDSEPGRGSTFAFNVRCGVPAIPMPAARGHSPSLDGLPVLVVEDNAPYREVLLRLFKGWGLAASGADDGETALEMMVQAQRAGRAYAFVLLDAQLPGIDGYAVAERVQREPQLAGSIIMCTGVGQRGDAARCRELGVAAYLSKPVHPSELLDTLLAVFHGGAQVNDATHLVTRHSLREAGAGHSILVTEDHDVNQVLATRVLSKLGHRVRIANNGREALAAVAGERFDLVLMDIQMPEMGGLEAAAAIRSLEAGTGARVPIIALTANAMQGDRDACLAAGMDDYLTKPFSAAQIDALLRRWLPQQPRHRAAAADSASRSGPSESAAAPRPACAAASPTVVLDIGILAGFVGDDPVELEEFLRIFLTSTAKAGAELRAAHLARRVDTIRGVSHRLKSSARTVGAVELGDLCATLEDAGLRECWDTIDRAMAGIDPLLSAVDESANRWLASNAA